MKTRSLQILALVLAAGSLLFAGCRGQDELSSRPWNTRQNWESGLPASLTEGR